VEQDRSSAPSNRPRDSSPEDFEFESQSLSSSCRRIQRPSNLFDTRVEQSSLLLGRYYAEIGFGEFSYRNFDPFRQFALPDFPLPSSLSFSLTSSLHHLLLSSQHAATLPHYPRPRLFSDSSSPRRFFPRNYRKTSRFSFQHHLLFASELNIRRSTEAPHTCNWCVYANLECSSPSFS